MKKLMVMMAAAASALGLMAADPTTYASEDFEDSAKFQEGKLIIGGETGWSCADEGATLTQGAYADREAFAGARNPAFASENLKYLNLKTTFGKPLERAVSATVGDDALFFDQLVKMTATDADPDLTGYESPKIVIYAIDRSEEDTPVAETNLMVVAGQYVGGELKTATYNLGNIDVDAWHRLTIKTIKAYNNSAVAFEIFVDGIAVPYTGSTKAYDSTAAASLTVTAKALNAAQKLFPSLVADASITAVAFDGQGQIDDFIATEVSPGTFTDDKFFMLGWDANVTALTYTAHGETVDVDDMTTQSISIPYAENMTVAVTPTFTQNWELDEIDGTDISVDNNVISVLSESASATITSKDATPRMAIEINGEPAGTAPSFAAALEAINALGEGTAKITLNQDITLATISEATEATITSGAEVTIDLAGKTITGPAGYEYGVIESTAALTIIDSVGTGKVVLGVGNTEAVTVQKAKLTVTGGTFEGPVTATTSEVSGGTFLKGEEEEFPLTCADGYEADGTTVEGYWTIVEKPWTITYYDGNEDVFATDTYTKSTAATKELNKGTREGYKFIRWEDKGFNEVTSLAGMTGDVDLYGIWEEIPAVAKIGEVKYPTIEAAVAAAKAGDTIVLLADCAIDGEKAVTLGKNKAGLYITKNLTIDAADDYTLTGPSGAYGIVVGGGATLTLKGGTFKELSTESRSIVNVGNPATDGDFGDEAFVGNLVLDGATIKGAGADTTAGNAIAAANGTVTITSGTVTDIGSRGVKAEGTATITINGGTITSNGTKPALYVKASGSITVNGGTIDGEIQNAAEKTATITIPGTSTATFDRDQSAFCAPGYKTFENGDGRWEVKAAKAVTITAGEGIASVMAGTTNLVGAVKIQPADLDTDVTLTADETIKTPVFKIAVNGADPVEVTSPFKLSSYITYGVIVEGATVVFTAEEGAAPVDPVDPEQPKEYKTDKEAEDAAKAINANKEAYINPPADAKSIAGFDHKAYVENFVAVANGTTVEVKLTEKAQSDLQEQVNSDVVTKIKPAELAAADGEAKLVTTPGFYYTVVAGNGIGTMAPQSCTFAETAETTVDLPSFSGAGFYTIKVTVKPVDIPNGK